jgi:threonine dehydratase
MSDSHNPDPADDCGTHGGLPTLTDVLAARAPVYTHLQRTPLHHYAGLSEVIGAQVFVKHENHHAVGAFKVRGGVNLACSLSPTDRAQGLFTASTGNHGLSIAFGGRVTGTEVTVAVPEGANPEKVAAIRAQGAQVMFHGSDFDEAREWIAGEASRKGARFIGPTDRELVAGVGTYTLEIMEDLPDLDVIFVPVGSGSAASAVCLVAKTLNPNTEVVAVQAEAAPAAFLAWRDGKPARAEMKTRAEGLATRVSFENAQSLLRDPTHGLDDFVLVSDEAMDDAIRLMLQYTHNLAEHAGAAALAGALAKREELAGKRVALVQSGGNLASRDLQRIVAS